MKDPIDMQRNLRDAGAGDDVILRFQSAERPEEKLRVLRCYRCELLRDIHHEQQKLDHLDYLIFTLKNQK